MEDEGRVQVSLSEIYDKGRKAGIREVVEWLKTCELNRCCDGVTDEIFCRNYRVYDGEWQAKLKEWGV